MNKKEVEIIVIGSLEYSKQFFSHAFLVTRKALKNKKNNRTDPVMLVLGDRMAGGNIRPVNLRVILIKIGGIRKFFFDALLILNT